MKKIPKVLFIIIPLIILLCIYLVIALINYNRYLIPENYYGTYEKYSYDNFVEKHETILIDKFSIKHRIVEKKFDEIISDSEKELEYSKEDDILVINLNGSKKYILHGNVSDGKYYLESTNDKLYIKDNKELPKEDNINDFYYSIVYSKYYNRDNSSPNCYERKWYEFEYKANKVVAMQEYFINNYITKNSDNNYIKIKLTNNKQSFSEKIRKYEYLYSYYSFSYEILTNNDEKIGDIYISFDSKTHRIIDIYYNFFIKEKYNDELISEMKKLLNISANSFISGLMAMDLDDKSIYDLSNSYNLENIKYYIFDKLGYNNSDKIELITNPYFEERRGIDEKIYMENKKYEAEYSYSYYRSSGYGGYSWSIKDRYWVFE